MEDDPRNDREEAIRLIKEAKPLASKKYFTFAEVALLIARDLRMSRSAEQGFIETLWKAARTGYLRVHVRIPGVNGGWDMMALRPNEANDEGLAYLVTRTDINAWFARQKISYSWQNKGEKVRVADDADAGDRDLAVKITEQRTAYRAAEQKRIDEGLYFLAEAAHELATELRKDDKWEALFISNMLAAAKNNALVVRYAKTQAPISPHEVGTAACMVTRDDVNEWLERGGFRYRWGTIVLERPVSPLQTRENNLLATLVRHGIDPSRVPRARRGARNPTMNAVREELGWSKVQFKTVLGNLRNGSKITEVDESENAIRGTKQGRS